MGKFGLKKLDTSLYHTMQSIFWYLELFRCDSQVWQTDRQTDRLAHSIHCAFKNTTLSLIINSFYLMHLKLTVSGWFRYIGHVSTACRYASSCCC